MDDSDVIDVFLTIKCRRIWNIAAPVIRDDRDVIAELVLIRITEKRVKRIADCNIARPGISAIEAV